MDAIAGPETYAAIDRIQAEMKSLDAQVAALPKPRMVYSGAALLSSRGHIPAVSAATARFRPGSWEPAISIKTGDSRGVRLSYRLTFVLPDDSEEGRRAALANWIADPDNMLTWRSIVNRVWHYHFGAGLVDTPSDFGRMGSKPSHPELLDWLAVWFRDEAKGSMKQLHRLILRSQVYQQQSARRADGEKLDAENRLLWRMNMTRLDAEAVRDSVLSVAGKLDLTMGGPAVQWFAFKDDHSPVYDYARFDPDAPGSYRRSIYRFIVRSVPDPFMERLDCPDPSVLTPKRSTTLTAIQALTMMNNPFVVRMSEHLAERVQRKSTSLPEQVNEAVRICFGRNPTENESSAFLAYARQHGMPNLGAAAVQHQRISFCGLKA